MNCKLNLNFSFILFSTFFLLTPLSYGAAESFGEYTVHYQAVNSTFVDADIAEQYGIVRSERRAFLNISVMKTASDGTMAAVPAVVSGGKRNLLGQSGEIAFREIREENAIYYIGEFEFSNAEFVRFAIAVQPEMVGESHEIRWETRMYGD
jgi:hypothetical protein